MDRRTKQLALVAVLVLSAAYLYFAFSEEYWAPGYAIRIRVDIPDTNYVSPFVTASIADYIGAAYSQNDILVTDPSGNPLPFRVDGDSVVVYAKDMTAGDHFYIFFSNPDETVRHSQDSLDGYYSLLQEQIDNLCNQAYLEAKNRHHFRGDSYFACYGNSPDEVFGTAWAGGPDDGTSVRLYHFRYTSDGTYQEDSVSTGSTQNYAYNRICTTALGWGHYSCLSLENSSRYFFYDVRPGDWYRVTLYDLPGSGSGDGAWRMGLTMDLHPIIEILSNSSSYKSDAYEITSDGYEKLGYIRGSGGYFASNMVPAAIGDGAGIWDYVDEYSYGKLIKVYRNTTRWLSSSQSCSSLTDVAAYSNGEFYAGTCKIVGGEVSPGVSASRYAFPTARVGSCYYMSDGNYQRSPYADYAPGDCYFPLPAVYTTPLIPTRYGAAFVPVVSAEPGQDYYIQVKFFVEHESASAAYAYHIRFDDESAALPVALSSVEVNDTVPPAVSATVDANTDTLTVHVSASDNVLLTDLNVVLTDGVDENVFDVPFTPAHTYDGNVYIDISSYAPGTELNVIVSAADLAGNTAETNAIAFTVPSPPSPPPTTHGGSGGGSVTTQPSSPTVENAEQEEGVSPALVAFAAMAVLALVVVMSRRK